MKLEDHLIIMIGQCGVGNDELLLWMGPTSWSWLRLLRGCVMRVLAIESASGPVSTCSTYPTRNPCLTYDTYLPPPPAGVQQAERREFLVFFSLRCGDVFLS